MEIENIQTGFQSLGIGTPVRTLNVSRQGDLMVSPASGDYQELTRRGMVYSASNQAAQAVSVALATTYTGICLSNPNGSTYDLVLLGCNYSLSVAPAAIASLHLIGGYSTTDVTHSQPLTATSMLLGPLSDAVAKVDSQATIPTPKYVLSLGSGFTAGALYGTTPNWIDLKGMIVIRPGGFVAIGALTAVTGFGSFVWAEVPR